MDTSELIRAPNGTSPDDVRPIDVMTQATRNDRVYRINKWKYLKISRDAWLVANHAHFDTREGLPGMRNIRVFATTWGGEKAFNGPLYCQLRTNPDSNETLSVKAHIYTQRRIGMVYMNKTYRQVLVSCPLHRSQLSGAPDYVTLATRRNSVSTCRLRVVNLVRQKPRFKVGICVPLMYGNISADQAQMFVEWVELHRLFGVSEFNLYNMTIQNTAPEFQRVLDFYVSRKIVRLTQVTPIVQSYRITRETLYDVSKSVDGGILNQCLAENMYRYESIISLDLDEILVPRAGSSYTEMLGEIRDDMDRLPKDIVSYVFPFAYFFLEYTPDRREGSNLTTLQFVRRTEPSYNIRVKSITNPRKCIYTYIHYCDLKFSSFQDGDHARALHYVTPSYGLVHHYRRECTIQRRPTEKKQSVRTCAKQLKEGGETDKNIRRFKKRLLSRVRSKFPDMLEPQEVAANDSST